MLIASHFQGLMIEGRGEIAFSPWRKRILRATKHRIAQPAGRFPFAPIVRPSGGARVAQRRPAFSKM
ncbi:MAG TPA: hypothetical protein VHZ29_13505 [Rhizomicrobium sp.]|nr:hypothetical protein [Rhizomicrobium sp.]